MRDWIKLMRFHIWKIILVLGLLAWALAVFPWEAWSYDSVVDNGDGTKTYTITASTSDGYIMADGYDWASVRTTGEVVNHTAQSEYGVIGAFAMGSPLAYYVRRVWLPFDTTGISGTVTAATLTLKGRTPDNDNNGVTCFVQGSATLPLDINDFSSFGSTEIASRVAWANSGWVPNAVSTAFNASGKTALTSALGGTFQITLLERKDLENETPTENLQEDAGLFFADSATDSYRPKLAITTYETTGFSDLFDGSGLEPKWTVINPYGGTGSASVSDGYLNIAMSATGDMPVIYQDDGLSSLDFDIRCKVHIPSLPSHAILHLRLSPQWSDAANTCAIVYNPSGQGEILRSDTVSGSSHDGASVDISTAQDFYARFKGDGLGSVTCYYKLTADGAWITLAAGSTTLTFSSTPLDFAFLAYSGSGACVLNVDWVVLDSEYPCYPACEAQDLSWKIIFVE